MFFNVSFIFIVVLFLNVQSGEKKGRKKDSIYKALSGLDHNMCVTAHSFTVVDLQEENHNQARQEGELFAGLVGSSEKKDTARVERECVDGLGGPCCTARLESQNRCQARTPSASATSSDATMKQGEFDKNVDSQTCPEGAAIISGSDSVLGLQSSDSLFTDLDKNESVIADELEATQVGSTYLPAFSCNDDHFSGPWSSFTSPVPVLVQDLVLVKNDEGQTDQGQEFVVMGTWQTSNSRVECLPDLVQNVEEIVDELFGFGHHDQT